MTDAREPSLESRPFEPDKAMVERAAEAAFSADSLWPEPESWADAAEDDRERYRAMVSAALVAAGGVPESALEKAARDVVDGYENRSGIVLQSGIEALKAALSGASVLHPETDSTEVTA